MILLRISAAAIAALLLLLCLPVFAAAQDDPSDKPAGWMAKELPQDSWLFGISASRDGELLTKSEYLYPLSAENPYFLFSDHETRGYAEDRHFIPASQYRSFVWIVLDEFHDELLSAAAWEKAYDPGSMNSYWTEWPRSMSQVSFQRILEHATHLQIGELHAYIYSDAGDSIELEIKRVVNQYSLEAMLAPELPLAGSLLKEIRLEMEFEDYATLTVQAQAGGLGWLDIYGNTVVLPADVTDTQLEARR